MKKIFYLLAVTSLLLFSCKKTDPLPIQQTTGIDPALKQKVHSWLNEQKKDDKDSIPKKLEAQMFFEQAWTETFSGGEMLLLVPLRDNYKTPNSTYKKTYKLAVFVVSKSKAIRLGNIVELIPSKEMNRVPVKLVSDIYQNKEATYDGIVSVININNKISFELGFKNNTLIYYSYPTIKKNNTANGKTASCVNVYWHITTYWSDGSSTDEYIYAYTSCSYTGCYIERLINKGSKNFKVNCDGGGDGGGGTPDPSSINFVSTNDIIKYLSSPCFIAYVDKIGDPKLKSFIFDLYQRTFVGFGNKFDLKFEEGPNLRDEKGNLVNALSNVSSTDPTTWVIRLNSDFAKSGSQEAWVAVILHEVIHGFIKKNNINFSTPIMLSHKEMLTSWTDALTNSLSELFPTLTPQEATALAINGVADLFNEGDASFSPQASAFLSQKYNMTYESMLSYSSGFYQNDSKGTKCK